MQKITAHGPKRSVPVITVSSIILDVKVNMLYGKRVRRTFKIPLHGHSWIKGNTQSKGMKTYQVEPKPGYEIIQTRSN